MLVFEVLGLQRQRLPRLVQFEGGVFVIALARAVNDIWCRQQEDQVVFLALGLGVVNELPALVVGDVGVGGAVQVGVGGIDTDAALGHQAGLEFIRQLQLPGEFQPALFRGLSQQDVFFDAVALEGVDVGLVITFWINNPSLFSTALVGRILRRHPK